MKEKQKTFRGEVEPKNPIAAERFTSYEVYRRQLDKGAMAYGEISRIPQEDERVKTVHPELLLFFSFINPKSSAQLKKPIDSPTLTEYGLKVEDQLYEYELPLRQQILRLEGKQVLRYTKDRWVLTEELSRKRTAFQSKYAEECEGWFRKKINQEFEQKLQEVKKSIDSPYLQNTVQRFGAKILCEQFPALPESNAESLFRVAHRYRDAAEKVLPKKWLLEEAKHNQKGEEDINTIKAELRSAQEKASEEHTKYNAALKKDGIEHLDIDSLIDRAKKDYQAAKDSFILEHNYVTEEEFSKLQNYKSVVQSSNSLIASSGIKTRLGVKAAYDDLRRAVRLEMAAEYAGEHSRERDYPELVRAFYKRGPIELLDNDNSKGPYVTVEEARRRLESKLAEAYGGVLDPFGNIDKTIELEREYLKIKEKYRRGEIVFGPTPRHAQQEFFRRRQSLREERDERYFYETTELTSNAAKSIEKRVASLVLGRNDIDDAVFVPAGCFVTYRNGGVGGFAVSPFDSRIEASLEPHEAEAWRNTWDYLRRQSVDNANEGRLNSLVVPLNEEFERLTNICAQIVPNETFNRLQELCRKYQISAPKLIASNSSINHPLIAGDLDSLEEILPHISKLVNAVDLEHTRLDGHHNMNLDGIMETLEYVLSNRAVKAPAVNARLSDLVWVNGRTIAFNLTLYKAILHDTGHNQEKTRSVFCACLGSELFDKIGDDAVRHFEEALGVPVNITMRTVFRLFKVKISSPVERHKIALRLLFIDELEKYATGESDPKMHSFFKSLDVFKD